MNWPVIGVVIGVIFFIGLVRWHVRQVQAGERPAMWFGRKH